ncbi:MAG: RNA 2',3'-cyclic phosphodiesterase [Candidatus Marinimicrobia bacterium]|nr:RNA 2',3'-cyclic phosphodiesterase [Candidatus Neomarinimicrobiota bacterium]MBT3675849.1 RNA 2',3'-cyclic phosphodiesterase [Candidatus Neomarinimicrobiota bacterium]MBT3763502.1 RNA 2',3'-cyclic phosphodiesterase [Candidatus Neomarinimicrobiota bacterium]MBT4068590.1 RNA 2',3'-cyclic phosphodiesterase [Candidatus Neomarinimicrobiota bacterium]MBT4271544.1 RNA 2',3'-cyclic phosphodiesterase [Candidatus Neomarinimicrobiota bacterium]
MDYNLIRTFIAVPVPQQVLELQNYLKSTVSGKTGKIDWVRSDQLHLTLKFLGDTTESSIGRVQSTIKNITKETSPFDLKIQGTGCFPKVERPRVMWAGIEGAIKSLYDLLEMIQIKLDPLGFPKDIKPFHPHITLGRAKYPQKRTPDISTFLNSNYDSIPFRIEKVQYISSELFPNGPIYTILSTHFFGNN